MKQALFVVFLFLIQSSKQANVVEETCKASSSEDPSVKIKECTDMFNSYCKSHGCGSSPKSLAIIATQITLAKAGLIRTGLQNEYPKIKSDPKKEPCVRGCMQLYGSAISNLNEAVTGMKKGNYNAASGKYDAVTRTGNACEQMFLRGGVKSWMTAASDGFFHDSVIAHAVVKLASKK